MNQKECASCKLLALMTELLKDSNETIRKLREKPNVVKVNMNYEFNPN